MNIRHAVFGLAVGFLFTNGSPAMCSETLPDVIKSLAAAKAGIGSLQANMDLITTRGDGYPGPDPFPAVEKSRIKWAVKGNLLSCVYDRKQMIENAGKQTEETVKMVDIYDGQKDSELNLSPSSSPYLYISKDRPSLFNPLETGYSYAGRWYADIVKSSTFQLDGTAEDPKFGHLVILTGEDPRGEDHLRLWVSTKYEGLVVRCEARNDRPALRVNQLTSVTRAAGMWVPMGGTYTESLQKDGKWGLWWTKVYAVHDLKVGPVPDSVFVLPKLTAGTRITNRLDRHFYEVGSSGEWMSTGTIGDHSAGQPKRAKTSGWLFMASSVTILLIAGMRIVNWRRSNVPA